jgi:hypothetical protein
VFGDKVLRKILGPKNDEVSELFRIFHEEHCTVFCCIVRIVSPGVYDGMGM